MIRLVSYSSQNIGCGIADYNQHLLAAMAGSIERETVAVTYDRIPIHRLRPLVELRRRYGKLAASADRHDVVLLQYYDRLWNGTRPIENTFPLFLKHIHKPMVMVLHEWPKQPPNTARAGSPPVRVAKSLLHWSVRRWEIGGADYSTWVNETMFKRMAHIVVMTRELADRLVRVGVPEERISVEQFPVHRMAPPCWSETEVRERYGLGDRRVLLLLGAAHPRKGYELAIRAMAKLPPDIVLVMVCPTRTEVTKQQVQVLLDLAKQVGVADRVVHIDFLESPELASVFAISQIALSPFTSVTGSSSVAHFIAGALPILASDLPTLRETRDAGAGMVMFKPGDVDDLRDQVLAVLANEGLRRQLAGKNRDYADHYSFEGLAERMSRIIERIAGAR